MMKTLNISWLGACPKCDNEIHKVETEKGIGCWLYCCPSARKRRRSMTTTTVMRKHCPHCGMCAMRCVCTWGWRDAIDAAMPQKDGAQ